MIPSNDMTSFFDKLNMKEEILSLYRGQNLPVKNILNESQYSIDGIWCSIGLTPQSRLLKLQRRDSIGPQNTVGQILTQTFIWDRRQNYEKNHIAVIKLPKIRKKGIFIEQKNNYKNISTYKRCKRYMLSGKNSSSTRI